jgi:SNF2 family DNA or RNA helicase
VSAVFGELDPSGQFIHVTCTGDDHDKNQFVSVLRNLTPNFNPVSADTMGVLLSWTAVTQLAHNFPGLTPQSLSWVPGPQLSEWTIVEIIRRSCDGDFTGQLPAREPMKHQRAGAVAIGMNGRFLLADDPGTGKGGTYFMGLAELEARGRNPWPALVVAPAGVVDTLLEEVALWYPRWKVAAYRGPGRQRYLKSDARLLVTSYQTMRNDVGDAHKPGPLLKLGAGAVVFDEVHFLCNHTSQMSSRSRRLAKHIPNVIAGSGTPITKNVASFWPVLNSMNPESYPSRDRYKSHFCLSRRADYGDTEVSGLDPVREPEFRVAMQGTFRRVAKEDVLKDLPPKTYQTRWLDIPAPWRKSYEQMRDDMLAELPDNMTPLEVMSTLAKMTRLAQLASSACDVRTWRETEQNPKSPHFGEDVQRTEVTMREPCWKAAALLDVLGEVHQGEGVIDDLGGQHGHAIGSRPVVAFAPSRQLVTLAGQMAEKKGYAVGYITGAVGNTERTEVRHAFQANKLDLVCVTTGAGGTGLTLHAADTLVFLMRPWSYVEAVQAEDRVHRRGQTKNVRIIDLVARNSIEANVRAALRDKASNLADLVRDRRIVESFLHG